MALYDGTLRFNTAIDTTGIKKAADVISQSMEGLKSKLSKALKININTEGIKKENKEVNKAKKDLDKYKKSQDAATKSQKEFGDQSEKTSGSVGKFGGALGTIVKAGLAAISVRTLVNIGKQAIETASDLQEVQNVVDVSFGKMSSSVDTWSKNLLKSYGISELTAKRMSSNFMAMGKGIGTSEENAAEMALRLTERAADIASFYNISAEEAQTKLKSVYTGETETLKSLGIVMTQTNLKNFAMTKGITQNIQEMDQATLTQLRYLYVMEQSKLAAGDFARTSDSWANQTRLLSENFGILKQNLGQGLIQALTPAVKYLNILMAKLIEFSKMISSVTAKLFGKQEMATSNEANAEAIDTMTEAQDDYTNSLKKTNKEAKRTLASFDEINKLGSDKDETENGTNGLSDLLGLGEVDFGEAKIDTGAATQKLDELKERMKSLKERIIEKLNLNINTDRIKTNFENTKKLFKGMWEDLKSLKNPLLNWFNGDFMEFIGQSIQTVIDLFTELHDTLNTVLGVLWDTIIFPVIKGIVEDVLPVITQMGTEILKTFSTVFGAVGEIVRRVVEDLRPLFSLLGQIVTDTFKIIHDFWDKYGAPIFEGLREAINTTKDSIISFWTESIKPIIDHITEALKEIWENHLKPYYEELYEYIGEVILTVEAVYNKIMPVLTQIANYIMQKLMPSIKTIINVVKSVVSGIIDAVKGFVTVLKGIFKIIRGIFTGDFKLIMGGFEDIFKGTLTTIKGFFSSIINSILDLIEHGVNAGVRAINKLLEPLRLIKEKTNIGFTIPDLPEVKLPRLASGTVIPANYGEFAAILGDNKREAEIVSPVSAMKQAFKEALSEMTGNGDETIILKLDGNVLANYVIKKHNSIVIQTGKSPLKGV